MKYKSIPSNLVGGNGGGVGMVVGRGVGMGDLSLESTLKYKSIPSSLVGGNGGRGGRSGGI